MIDLFFACLWTSQRKWYIIILNLKTIHWSAAFWLGTFTNLVIMFIILMYKLEAHTPGLLRSLNPWRPPGNPQVALQGHPAFGQVYQACQRPGVYGQSLFYLIFQIIFKKVFWLLSSLRFQLRTVHPQSEDSRGFLANKIFVSLSNFDFVYTNKQNKHLKTH